MLLYSAWADYRMFDSANLRAASTSNSSLCKKQLQGLRPDLLIYAPKGFEMNLQRVKSLNRDIKGGGWFLSPLTFTFYEKRL